MSHVTGSASEEHGNGAMLFEYCWPLYQSLHEVSSSKTDVENAFFVNNYVCDHL